MDPPKKVNVNHRAIFQMVSPIGMGLGRAQILNTYTLTCFAYRADFVFVSTFAPCPLVLPNATLNSSVVGVEEFDIPKK